MNFGFLPSEISFLISASASSVLIPSLSMGIECISALFASNADIAPTYVGSSVITASPGLTRTFASSYSPCCEPDVTMMFGSDVFIFSVSSTRFFISVLSSFNPPVFPYWSASEPYCESTSSIISRMSSIGNVRGFGIPPPKEMKSFADAYFKSSLISEGLTFFSESENLNCIGTSMLS